MPLMDDKIEAMVKALSLIALMPDEDNEWDGTDKFRAAREIAMKALNWEVMPSRAGDPHNAD